MGRAKVLPDAAGVCCPGVPRPASAAPVTAAGARAVPPRVVSATRRGISHSGTRGPAELGVALGSADPSETGLQAAELFGSWETRKRAARDLVPVVPARVSF